ncbi:divalent-cation tolerance protein CutA [Shewanella benthica]|uniref:divalent-cation tolerance protein CutA n=1 Tax=Shewanella benthica TaxID=43661 RepID=UPI001879F281|nr:divalent-cation tolerance protein CutA [Shewanella benthica]MBE7215023.1 divalent-cation tolerance protein CutA [Shewanella benthica]MCL1061985.1 divalent-cation tolerance protein CutA [Shewanella benthica]
MQNKLLLVITTFPSKESAIELAKELVENKLAACIQISAPVTSIYLWQDKVCEEQEYQLQIKCTQACYSALEQTISQQHPYQVPEIIAIPINDGLPEYINWVNEVTSA